MGATWAEKPWVPVPEPNGILNCLDTLWVFPFFRLSQECLKIEIDFYERLQSVITIKEKMAISLPKIALVENQKTL